MTTPRDDSIMLPQQPPLTPWRAALPWCSALVILLLLCALGGWYLRPSPPQYQTITVEQQPLIRTILATGQLDAINKVEVGTEISGQLQELAVQLGDRVNKGQLLATLDPYEAENAVAMAQTALRAAAADEQAVLSKLKLAQLQQQRLVHLVRQQAAKQEALDEADHLLALEQANCCKQAALLEQRRLELQQKQRELAKTRITAPFAGSVVAIKVAVGQTVVSSQAASPLLTIAELRRITVRALISEADIIYLTPGLDAEFTLLGDSQRRFRGTILILEGMAEKIDNALFYPALFEVDNPDGLLRLGMTAQVSITLERINDTLVIPMAALGTPLTDSRYLVQVLVAGKPQPRPVTVGARNEVMVQITEGLTVGETVIIAETPLRAL